MFIKALDFQCFLSTENFDSHPADAGIHLFLENIFREYLIEKSGGLESKSKWIILILTI